MNTKPMKATTILLALTGLILPLLAQETEYEKWGRIRKELCDENSRRFREDMRHEEILKQQERIHRESVIQRERIADDNRKQLERIERVIPRYPGYRVRDYYTPRPIFPLSPRP